MSLPSSFTLSDRGEYLLVWALRLVLAGLVAFGVVRANVGVAVNSGVGLLVSWLPALVRREVGFRLDAGLVVLITVSATLHAVGTLGPYRAVWWWDYLTHALSAFTVTAVAYAVVVTIDRHAADVALPQPYLSFSLVLFSIAAAVLWEIIEFAVTKLSSGVGTEPVLVVFGVSDITTDILFTALGGLAAAVGATAYFRTLARRVVGRGLSAFDSAN